MSELGDEISEALEGLALAIRFGAKEMGKEGASGMGAIEALGDCVLKGCDQISHSIERLADAIESHGR